MNCTIYTVTQFLPSSGCVDTAVWMHHMDANKTAGEEATWQLHKNVASNIEKSWQQHPTNHQLYGHLHPSRKLSGLDEPDMQDTAEKAGTSS